MTTHSIKILPDPLSRIRSGIKTVEGRLASKLMQSILPGDTLRLTCGDDCHEATVAEVRHFSSFDEMVSGVGVGPLGFPEMTVDQLLKLYRRIYWYPNAERNGVLAITLAT